MRYKEKKKRKDGGTREKFCLAAGFSGTDDFRSLAAMAACGDKLGDSIARGRALGAAFL